MNETKASTPLTYKRAAIAIREAYLSDPAFWAEDDCYMFPAKKAGKIVVIAKVGRNFRSELTSVEEIERYVFHVISRGLIEKLWCETGINLVLQMAKHTVRGPEIVLDALRAQLESHCNICEGCRADLLPNIPRKMVPILTMLNPEKAVTQ